MCKEDKLDYFSSPYWANLRTQLLYIISDIWRNFPCPYDILFSEILEEPFLVWMIEPPACVWKFIFHGFRNLCHMNVKNLRNFFESAEKKGQPMMHSW